MTVVALQWLLALLALVGAVLAGCNGLSGRNVPIGNPAPARITGVVVDERDPAVPIADALVQILADDVALSATTDTNGQFVLQVPKGKELKVIVRPPAPLAVLFQQAAVTVEADDEEVHVVIPLLPLDISPPAAPSLRIVPDSVTLRLGERQRFRALTDGTTVTPRPVWSVHGKVGIIDADGLFTATRVGKGKVRVRVGNLKADAQVTVVSVTGQ
ncbi:hypothetical protein HRbin17_00505 [bacterium HR17]|uniref:BIG2 domain-containing protein n=1 Tax=Candidatus Fervidibacter japonicus TaxID=2035412 RepID=A0A2H5X9Z6_9BACT|nr:hypothetical protein HRbin17_00505 [bacterium HR17]